jgi:hypothetical protein
VGSDPTNKQMILLSPEKIFTDHPVIIATNVKNNPVTPIA